MGILTDFSYLRTQSGDDIEFIKEMIEIYIQKSADDLLAIHAGIANGDYKAIADVAHSLKTSVNFMGAKDLHAKTVLLETLSKTKANMAVLQEIAMEMTNENTEVLQELEQELKTMSL